MFEQIEMKPVERSQFDLSHSVISTTNIHRLEPVQTTEILPGDKVRVGHELFLKIMPLVRPVMQNLRASVHTFFVPYRILWDGWEYFISGEPFRGTVIVNCPAVPIPQGANLTKTATQFFNSFGLRVVSSQPSTINILPLAAYWKIYDEYYRDQALENPMAILDQLKWWRNDSSFTLTSSHYYKFRCYLHDYFTSARPDTGAGNEVRIPIRFIDDAVIFRNQGGSPGNITATPSNIAYQQVASSDTSIPAGQLYAQLINGAVQADAGTIQDIRRAFRLAEFWEKMSVAGQRYAEVILAHFASRSSDGRLNRPEYINGSVFDLQVGEVLNTSNTGLGNFAGHGYTYGQTDQNIEFVAEEHGVLMSILSITGDNVYHPHGPKMFFRQNMFDFAWPSFAEIGEQPLEKRELNGISSNTNVIGYTPRYSEYKYKPNLVAGDIAWEQLNSGVSPWTGARDLVGVSTLGQLVQPASSPGHYRNMFQNTNEDYDHAYFVIKHNLGVERALPYYGTPSI